MDLLPGARMADAALFDDVAQSDACSSSRSAAMTTAHAHRDSDISVSKFNRWVVLERSRAVGDDGRNQLESLRTQRKSAQESHREYGASLAAASRAQIQRDRQECDAMRQSNLMKGLQVRDDVLAYKEEAQRLRSEWVEYGRKLSDNSAEQKRRIRDSVGEGSKRVQDLVAACKLEEEEFERELADRRADILDQNRNEVLRIKEETADTVIDAAKQYALDRRREQAKGTKSAMAAWDQERKKNTAAHLKTAQKNRAEAEATRAHAKQLREAMVKQRQKEAQTARETTRRNKLAKDQALLESGAGIKAVHDNIYRSKYVPQESAEMLATSPTAKVLAQSRASGAASPTASKLNPSTPSSPGKGAVDIS